MKKNDQDIIESIINGNNTKALEQLYKEPLRKIRRHIVSNSGSVEDANDIFQDAVLVLFHYIKNGKFDIRYNIEAFLLRIAKNAWIDKVRKNKKKSSVDVETLEVLNDQNQLSVLMDDEKLEAFTRVFNKLEDNCKELLRLVLFDKKSMREIKDIMRLKHENVAKSQHYRCKKYFTKILLSDKIALSVLRP